ncbi:MAG TPA: porphobilinogen synthase [Phycisphaerae bacterium]|nr:porphobilinogen synthase [Phycisphaerae bacterium]
MQNQHRPRRLRSHPRLRDALNQTRLAPADFVAPLFIRSGKNIRNPVKSMPGVFQLSVDEAVKELKHLDSLGVGSYILFGVTDSDKKDPTGSHAHNPDNEVCRTLKAAKDAGVGMLAITDLCYCEYTSHGHCGPLTAAGVVDNDATIKQLGQQAALHAAAGADVVAPSGMMDNMVAAIRSALDGAGNSQTAILSYAVKYASSFYGPFRDAAESPPQFGDRKTYQMDFRQGAKEALREAAIDVEQGADMIMVKPGIAYLDILSAVTQAVPVPASVYQVSGEYAMIKAAAANGWIDEKGTVLETMHAFRRAGASLILTYYAAQLADWLA